MAARRQIAIACQGGGTNAAFGYGVLRGILTDRRCQRGRAAGGAFEIMALSGTSAGALCAFMTWYGLVAKNGIAGSPAEAVVALDRLWEAFTARTPAETVVNAAVVQGLRAQARGLPTVRVSPYAPGYDAVLSSLGLAGVRPEFTDFAALLEDVAPDFDAIDQASARPRLFIGAVEILSGLFETFDSHALAETRRNISLAAVRASGTLPDVRKAESIPGFLGADGVRRDGLFWDGLFSQNPPIREFVTAFPVEDRPDEIWVIRINPQQRSAPPRCPDEIEDRRNELAGNLSLNQELQFIQTVNGWCEAFADFGCRRKKIVIRTIKMRRSTAERLDLASKFDRSASLVERLRREGEDVAAAWLRDWLHALPA
jgi:NTE family protein